MTTLQKSPTKVSQTTKGNYVMFSGIENIKTTNTKTYAVSSQEIMPKSFPTQNRPSTVTAKEFKFNIPTNAVVSKITVHYRHFRRAVCPKSGTTITQGNTIPCPSTNTNNRCNIPAPTISVLNTNLSKKGQAPYGKIGKKVYGKLNNTMTFDVELKANVVNSKDFGVKIDYPKNANEQWGFVMLSYVYITIEYQVPSFSVSASDGNTTKVYNKQQYHLKVNCSDPSLSRQTTNVLITIPNGFSFVKNAGVLNGKLVQISAETLQWTPNLRWVGSVNLELIFDVNVSFASGETTGNFPFYIGLPIYSSQISHTVTIYKPTPAMESEEADKETFDDTDAETSTNKQVWGTLNESFLLSLELTAEEIEEYSHEGDFPLSFRAYTGELASNDWYYSNIDNETLSQLSPSAWRVIDEEDQYIFNDYFKVLNTIGEYTLQVYAIVGGVIEQGMTEVLIRELNIRIRPQQSTLTDLNYALLDLTTEELNRLGDGYTYTAQSDMKLDTSELYVRDWYKNFRIGIFNNPIQANISTYYQYDNMEETFDGYITIPPTSVSTGATVEISATPDIRLQINDEEYIVNDPITISLEDYYIPTIFTKENEDNVVLTVTAYNGDYEETYSTEYHINFNADETTDLTEITVDTTDYDNLTNDEIVENAEYWSEPPAEVNTTENITCEFPYRKKYPIHIIITGDYVEGDIENNNIEFSEPCIVESTEFTQKTENGNYPIPIDDLVVADASGEILVTSFDTSDTIVFYDLPLDEGYGTNSKHAIRGIELAGEIQQADSLVIYAKLKSPTGESRERSTIINENVGDATNSFSIGGNGDLWGFNTLDMVNIEDWEVELTISNSISDTDSSINFGEVKLILYLEDVQKQNVTCLINGQDISYYGAFITDLKIPEGLQTDTAYLSVDGTDINDAYRQNIREKEISIEFDIGDGCDLEASTLSLREFAKLLVNDRDEYNRPIPKRIEFSHYNDVYWEYVMEDAFDSELDVNTYQVKAKLTVPAGTSYSKESITTSTSGYVNGLASINPVLVVKPNNDNVSIRETVTNQEFHIGYTGGWEDKILEIDCEDRICWLKENEEDTDPVNLNRYVDYNSDWFVLKEDYAFEGTGCVIRTVDYQERW